MGILKVKTVSGMKSLSERLRRKGLKIGFVPTMGFLHRGHLELVKYALKVSDHVVVSIFVNRIQFNDPKDYASYPIDIGRDSRLLEEAGAHTLFLPDAGEIYPAGFSTYVNVEAVTENLCGLSRPGHFRGVATVVNKLFNIVRPYVAIFGEKDYQQLVVIKKMVKDLDMDIKVVGRPTVREADGLAMSSRNVHLSQEEREAARIIPQALSIASDMVKKGEKDAEAVIRDIAGMISSKPGLKIDYIKVCDPETMKDQATIPQGGKGSLLAVAVFAGTTRLIDNCILGATVRDSAHRERRRNS